jgi:hypothetical protein
MAKKIQVKISMTREELTLQAEMLVHKDQMSYAEAICHLCEQRMIDPADMAKLVKGPLKFKLEAEAMNRNIIKRTTSTLF